MQNSLAHQSRAISQYTGLAVPPPPSGEITALSLTEETTGVAKVKNIPQESPDSTISKFGSAETDIAAEVAGDIAECDRINGAEDFFGSTESRIQEKLKPAYKVFLHANRDPAYRDELAKQLRNESGGTYAPSTKKPWCLAAFVALKPETEAHEKQTYSAAYYFQHAAMAGISLDSFVTWIEGRNLKESIAFVRARKKPAGEPKAKPYPNIAKARKLKKHAGAAKILKDAFDMAEDALKKLFDQVSV